MLLLIVISAIVIYAMIRWRIRLALYHAREKRLEANRKRSGFPWSLFGADPLKKIKDPREAAAAMMTGVAETHGRMSAEGRALIVQFMISRFETSPATAEAFLESVSIRTKDAGNVDHLFRRLAPVVKKHLDVQERKDFLKILVQLAKADGNYNPDIQKSLGRLKKNLS